MARGLNKLMLIGNLGGDPELKYSPDGTAFANASPADSVRKRDSKTGEWGDETEWFKLVFFGASAENVSTYGAKGRPLYAEGRFQSRSFTDREGVVRTVYEVAVTQWLLLGSD